MSSTIYNRAIASFLASGAGRDMAASALLARYRRLGLRLVTCRHSQRAWLSDGLEWPCTILIEMQTRQYRR
jgi:hypothetical protein